MNFIDPKQLAAAIHPIVDQAIVEAGDQLAQKVAPAIGEAIKASLDGLTITIVISKKE